MWQFKIFFPQNLATLAHYFHKNPLYELHWIFLSASGENSPQKKKRWHKLLYFCTICSHYSHQLLLLLSLSKFG
jgi:hypothetical protein